MKIIPRLLTVISWYHPIVSMANGNYFPYEARLGVAKNDIRGRDIHYNVERGYNIQLEFLFDTLHAEFWRYLLNPKSHVGFSVNTKGGTNQFYTGLTWSFHIWRFYLEPTFGCGANDAKKKRRTHRKQALGSSVLFRESFAIGCDITCRWIGYAFIDHVSNAHLGCVNPGITTVGARIGYRF